MKIDKKSRYFIFFTNIDLLNTSIKNKPSIKDWDNNNNCSIKIENFLLETQISKLFAIVFADIKNPNIIKRKRYL